MTNKKRLVVLALFLVSMSGVWALDIEFPDYWGVGLGYMGSFNSSDYDGGGVSFSYDGQNSQGFGLSVISLDVLLRGKEETVTNGHGRSAVIRFSDTSILVGAAIGYPLFHNKLAIFAGGGLGFTGAKQEVSGETEVTSVIENDLSNTTEFAWKINAGLRLQLEGFYVKADLSYGTILGPSFGIGLGLGWMNDYGYTPTPKYTPPPTPAPKPAPAPPAKPVIQRSLEFPMLTIEELNKIEALYAETIRDIESRGRRLYITSRQERAAFIRRWQGVPNTAQVDAAKQKVLDKYYSNNVSDRDIVAMAKNEPNDFLKVRMIHDWVADIFLYDYDLLDLMERNIIQGNFEFTLGQLVIRERGVCADYTILFWFLMDEVGLDVYYISDRFNPTGGGHAYNMVVINGTGYIVDTTWDSGNRYHYGRITQFNMMVRKDYFMPSVSQSFKVRGW